MDGLTYTVIGILGGFSVLKMLAGKEKMYATLFLNIVFGCAMYLMLNICDFTIPFNTLSASCIAVLGFPGVILLIILKIIFRL